MNSCLHLNKLQNSQLQQIWLSMIVPAMTKTLLIWLRERKDSK